VNDGKRKEPDQGAIQKGERNKNKNKKFKKKSGPGLILQKGCQKGGGKQTKILCSKKKRWERAWGDVKKKRQKKRSNLQKGEQPGLMT